MFNRFQLLVGDKFDDITNKLVLIIGLGGVGSYALESLVRSGIKRFVIVDNDTIDISNLNRQLMATQKNIGEYKTKVWYNRIKSINPDCQVITINEFIEPNNINQLFKYKIDYLIDACDTVSTKISLIEECHKHHVKLISCMGTGNKLDPRQLEVTDIYRTSYDPLAKIIRKKCRELGIKKQLVICSREQRKVKNTNVLPSCSFVPATAGLLITSYIINDIVGEKNV